MTGNISEYRSTILTHLSKLPEIGVVNKKTNSFGYPFKDWSNGKLEWWSIYTGIKHNLVDSKATLGVALSMLQAYELLIFSVSAFDGDIHLDIFDTPQLFQVNIPVSSAVLSSNVEWVKIYERNEFLRYLGYIE